MKKGRILKFQAKGPLPTIPNESYASFILNRLKRKPDAVALVDTASGASFTYEDLHRLILSFHAGLQESGIKEGDTVVIISSNNLEMPAIIYSIILAGAICVPINPLLTSEELVPTLVTAEPKWAVIQEDLMPKVEASLRKMGSSQVKNMWVFRGGDRPAATKWPSVDELKKEPKPYQNVAKFDPSTKACLMLFSSGTTGLPKGVLLSHRNFLAICMNSLYSSEWNPTPNTRNYQNVLHMLPLCHIYGFLTMNFTLINGGKIAMLKKFSSQKYFEAIAQHQITLVPLTPHIMEYLINTQDMRKHDLPHFKQFSVSSTSVRASMITKVMEMTKRQVFQAYGLTETTGNVCISQPSNPKSVGKLILFNEAKVIDVETGELLPEGLEGELCVRGPYIMMGYFKNPKATSEIIDSDGWLHTGDMAYYDKEEFIYITDRIKDLIKVKGFQVSPEELEALIRQLEGVQEVAVAGVQHEKLGEAPKAWVVPKEKAVLKKEEIMKYVADRVSPYKQLQGGVEIVESLPRNFMNKILRRELRTFQEKPHSKL